MQVIRKADLIANIAENWRLANQRRNEWLVVPNRPHPQGIYQSLLNLGPNADAADIATITGDDRWTATVCQECGEDRDVLVAFGASEVTHPTDTAYICVACLEAAAQMARRL